jgi:hypothetical protein
MIAVALVFLKNATPHAYFFLMPDVCFCASKVCSQR